jgi:hypothetical protein
MPVLTLPLALIALSSVPALLAIYWLRNRYRHQVVSSLHLWLDHRDAREGGTRVKRMQIPLLLIVEIFVLILLALAATDPRVLMASAQRPLLIVLDDSYSMLAGGRDRAADALQQLLREEKRFAARILLAREQPAALTETLTTPTQVADALKNWRCQSPTADLQRAVALAYDVGGKQSRILVLTDRPAQDEPKEGRLQWWAFGEASPNVAIVNAVRTTDGDRQRVLLEIGNFSASTARTELLLNNSPRALELAPAETRRLWLDLSEFDAPFHARLGDDSLAFDNAIVLLPDDPPPLRVALDVRHELLHAMLSKALQGTRHCTITSSDSDIILTDQQATVAPSPESWLVRFTIENEPAAFVGPFLVDRSHPLTHGLQLDGVIWSALSDQPMSGRPLVAAGNTSLLTIVDRSSFDSVRFDVHIRLNPDQSTVQSTANFPILLWNLVAWRQSAMPGIQTKNVRLGSQVAVVTEPGIEVVRMVDPQDESQSIAVRGRTISLSADQPGIYKITSGGNEYQFAANALSRDESDLRPLATRKAGSWISEASLRHEYRSISWVGLLLALGLLTLHAFLISRRGGSGS